MFKCDACKQVTAPYDKLTKVVTERRSRAYDNGPDRAQSVGWEIAKEVNVCPDCAHRGNPSYARDEHAKLAS